MKDMQIKLKEYCNDHYKHFGCYPFEFEYKGKVYDIILPNFDLREKQDD